MTDAVCKQAPPRSVREFQHSDCHREALSTAELALCCVSGGNRGYAGTGKHSPGKTLSDILDSEVYNCP